MGGVIRPDVRGSRCDCGGKFERVEDPEYEHPVPRCDECGRAPRKIKVRICLPALGKADIRYTAKGTRIKTLAQADAFLIDVKREIQDKTFAPEAYMTKTAQEQFATKRFVRAYLDRKARNTGKRGSSPGFLKDAERVAKNHLIPYFGEMDIREIKHSHLVDFLESAGGGRDQRRKALEMLRPIMREAAKDFSLELPQFPSIPKSNAIPRERLLDRDTQIEIWHHLKVHQDPIHLLIIYPIRPCEVRAIQWRDVDLKNGTLTIQRHFSGNELIPGRKSNTDPNDPLFRLALRLVPEAREIFEGMIRPLDPSEYVFKTKTGKPLYEAAMRRQWSQAVEAYNEQRKKEGRPSVDNVWFYADTKHVTMDYYHNELAIPAADLKSLSGHTSERTVRRYSPTKSLNMSDRYADKLGGAKGVQKKLAPENVS